MAIIEHSSEFMTNMVAGKPIPPLANGDGGGIPGNPKRQFAVIQDEHQRPMVIHLTDEASPKLMILQHDDNDVLRTVDLGKVCGMDPDDSIQVFDIVQDEGLTLYLSFVFDRKNQGKPQLRVMKPFMPNDPVRIGEEGFIHCFSPGRQEAPGIEQIIMTPRSTDRDNYYPMILCVARGESGRHTLAPIVVNPRAGDWDVGEPFPERWEKILKIIPAARRTWQGWVIQYESDGSQGFYRFLHDSSTGAVSAEEIDHLRDLFPHDNVTALCDALDPEDKWAPGFFFSNSQGLWLSFHREHSPREEGLLVSGHSHLKNCRNLQWTNYKDNAIRIWFRNSFNEVGYLQVNRNKQMEIRETHYEPTLLLPAEDSVWAEPVALGEDTGHGMEIYWQSVIVADSSGSLTHLQQASDTGHWHQKPFYTHHDEEVYQVDSYTITIRPLQEDQSPLIKGWVKIHSSSAVTGYLNGRNVTLSPNPQWFDTDFEGALHFIIPTTSMACPTLTITGLQTKTHTSIRVESTVIDPAKKIADRQYDCLDKVGSWKGLKDLKTQDGKHVFDQGAMAGDQDFLNGFDQLQQLRKLHQSFYAADGSIILPPGSFLGIFSDIGHFFARSIKKASEWFIHAAGDVVKFVAKIGEETLEFVLDTAEKVMHAATWIWNKLKAALKHLIELLGHIFNWHDICNTKNTISALINASIDLLAEKAGGSSDNLMDTLESTAKHFRDGKTAREVHANIFKPNSAAKSSEEFSSNTSVLWITERLKNGGMANMPPHQPDSVPLHPDVIKSWKNTVPHVQKIQPHVKNLANAISGSVGSESSVSSNAVSAPAQDFAQTCLDALKSIAAGLLGGVQIFLEQVRKYGNAKITIPVISGLYKTLIGHDLTVFDAISLIFGIVVNTITAIITGSSPPIIDGLKEKESDMPGSAASDKLAELLFGNCSPAMLKAWKTILSGATVAVSIFDRIVGYFEWLKRTASGDMTETASFGFWDCFKAVGGAIVTLWTFPTDKNMPALEMREAICGFNLIKNVAQISAACFSSAKDATEGMCFDILIVLIDTGVSVIASALGIAAGALELAAKSWKDYNEEKSTAGIIECVLSATESVSYFLVYIDPENLDLSVPSAIIWQGAATAKIPVQCFKWGLTL